MRMNEWSMEKKWETDEIEKINNKQPINAVGRVDTELANDRAVAISASCKTSL